MVAVGGGFAEIKGRAAEFPKTPNITDSLCGEMREACEERRLPKVCREDEDFARYCEGYAVDEKRRMGPGSGVNRGKLKRSI